MITEQRVTTLEDLISTLELSAGGAGNDFHGKRSRPRFTLVIPVSVRAMHDDGPGPEVICRLWDVSSSGMCATSYFKFEENALVAVDVAVNDLRWTGPMQVMHCTQTVSGYKIGLRLLDAEDSPPLKPAGTADVPAPASRPDSSPPADGVVGFQAGRCAWGLMRLPLGTLMQSSPEASGGDKERPTRPVGIEANLDTHLILASSAGWRPLLVRVENLEAREMSLVVSRDLIDPSQAPGRMAGATITLGMPVIVGFGNEPHTLWVPAEVARREDGGAGRVRLALLIETPRAVEFFGTGELLPNPA